MTTVVISGTVSGYAFAEPITEVSIATTGYVVGDGVSTGNSGFYISTVINAGRVDSTANGVYFLDGGFVTNGADTNKSASIDGAKNGIWIRDANGFVDNFGTIVSNYSGDSAIVAGVYVFGGSVTNGSLVDTSARIDGVYGVASEQSTGVSTITNFGTVEASKTGVGVANAAVINNGAATSPDALIKSGYIGIRDSASSTIHNFGTVLGLASNAIYAESGGVISNGGGADDTALIEGYVGVFVRGDPLTVKNLGTIIGAGAAFRDSGIYVGGGGLVTNGGMSDRAALIEGYGGVLAFGKPATVVNFATILSTAQTQRGDGSEAVTLYDGGSMTNGGVNDATALIEGYDGFASISAGVSTNFGVIDGTGGAGGGDGVFLDSGASLVNGAANDTVALIEGYVGASMLGGDTLTNFGTILGVGGVAVEFENPGQELVVEAGSVFEGLVNLDAGTLALGAAVGTIASGGAGAVVISGSMPKTTIHNVAGLVVQSGAEFTASGALGFAAGEVASIEGALSTASAFTNAGTLDISGTLAGTGTLALTGGGAAFEDGAILTIGHVTEIGATTTATVSDATLDYAGVWRQSAGMVSVSTGDRINFTGAGDSFAGTLAGAGVVGFIGGSDALAGAHLTAASVVINGATVTLSGAITDDSTVSVTTPKLIVASAGATLSGTGAIDLSNLATNEITGETAAATLTNVSAKITGAGLLGGGSMILINDSGGLISGNQTTALTVNTGASMITNAGLIENAGAGGTTVVSAVDNAGRLIAAAGTLTIEGAVSGSGTGQVNAGTLDFTSTFNQDVTFAGASTGTLELAHSRTYLGTITGFSLTGATALDLVDIGFVSGTTKASYAGTASGGVLTVKDGSEVATIRLTGDYLASVWTLTSDGHGGTRIVDPTRTTAAEAHDPAPTPPIRPFVQAMAEIGATAAPMGGTAGVAWRDAALALVSPRAQIA